MLHRVVKLEARLDEHVTAEPVRFARAGSTLLHVEWTFQPSVDVRIEASPAGAAVTVDGAFAGQAPLSLPPVLVGRSLEILIQATDHIPLRERLLAEEDIVLVRELERGRKVEILSEPSPAAVMVDGSEVGQTPLADAVVPSERAFDLVISRPGYRALTKRVDGRRLKEGAALSFALKALPLRSLALTTDERAEVSRIERALRSARRELARVTRARASANARASASHRQDLDVFERAEVENDADRYGDRIDELEARIEDLEGEIEGIRDVVSQRTLPSGADRPR
ncbi:MAG: PEGA domain-containing protein [Myxococcales bacterium]|nr:PEGA domain-containing protein [Myxococcales bacterium]